MMANLTKPKIIIILAGIAVALSFAIVSLQINLTSVSAQIIPIVVSTNHLDFGASFPGEERQGDFIVSISPNYQGDGITYRIIQRRKPLPENYIGDGEDPNMPGYYRNLCPYLTKATSEGEGDVETLAKVGDLGDSSDKWIIYFSVPAIVGNVAQDHAGGVVTTNGEYGCDISIDIDLPQCVPQTEICDNTIDDDCDGYADCDDIGDCALTAYCLCGNGTLDAGEECDDGNRQNGDYCSSVCQFEPGAIVINEVFYDVDPAHGADGGGSQSDEWVELYNNSNLTINLKDWTLTDNSAARSISNRNLLFAPHTFAVIAKAANTWTKWTIPSSALKIEIGNNIGNGLANTGDHLILKDNGGTVIDMVGWQTDTFVWNPAVVGVVEGHSIARSPYGKDTDQPSDFIDLITPNPGTNPHDNNTNGVIYGCTDENALNYNSQATNEDNSCQYTAIGCMDPYALNYNPIATIDDNSCAYSETLPGEE